jgi:predicted small secreted protein
MVPKKMFGTFGYDLRFILFRRKGTEMKIFLKLALALGFFSTLAACNTIDGVGKDVESAGEEIQDAAD